MGPASLSVDNEFLLAVTHIGGARRNFRLGTKLAARGRAGRDDTMVGAWKQAVETYLIE
jgi:hypothetical protein